MNFRKIRTGDGYAIEPFPADIPTHPGCMEIWMKACAQQEAAARLAVPERQGEIVDHLVAACNRAAVYGEDSVVRECLAKASRQLDASKFDMRRRIFMRAFSMAIVYFAAGLALAVLWELITPPVFLANAPQWSKIPLAVAIFSLGWLAYLAVGFSVGWLFNVMSALRVPTQEKLSEYHAAVESKAFAMLGHAIYLSLFVVALIFLEGQIEQLETFAAEGQRAGFFLGVVAGFAEKRIRDLTGSLFDRL